MELHGRVVEVARICMGGWLKWQGAVWEGSGGLELHGRVVEVTCSWMGEWY